MGVPRWLEIVLVASSLVMFVGSIVAIPWIVRRLPPDHFVRPPRRRSLATKIVRNALGAALVALGIAMLVLPGQGILTILVGLSVMDLRVRHAVVRRLLTHGKIGETVQRMRSRAGKPPLAIPEEPVTE